MLPYTLSQVPATSFPPKFKSKASPPPKKNTTNTSSHYSPKQLTPLLQRCKTLNQLTQIHAAAVKSGADKHPVALFKILRLCAALESADYAAQIFARIKNPDVYHFTALVGGEIAAGSCAGAARLYLRMLTESVRPDMVVLSYVLKACVLGLGLELGRQLHAQVVKLELGCERIISMRLIEIYGKFGDFGNAKLVFDELPDGDAVAPTILISCYSDHGLVNKAREVFDGAEGKDTACWTAMIDGCARNGRASAALELFREMQRENVRPNEVTVVCVLSACSQLGSLELGRWVHSYSKEYGIRLNTFLGSALIDMYARCASLEDAWQVFDGMVERDVIAYNSMIAGLAMHGRSREAVGLYWRMLERGLRPTHVTFVGVLNACSHGGLVDDGLEIFESMAKNYGLEPQIEHYGCMVDLLGRIGRQSEAYQFIKEMKVKPDHVIWGSLLGACKVHGDLNLAEKITGILFKSEEADSGTFVLLANVYASFGKWNEAVRIRAKMREKGILKEPGCSSIEVDNEIHEFLLGDIRHPAETRYIGSSKIRSRL